MKTIPYKFLILVLALLIPTISIYTHALKKETKLNNQEKIKSQEETRLQEQNQKYLDIISKHSPKTPDLPRRANGEINWLEVNWFEEIILPEDYNVYKLMVKEKNKLKHI